MQQSLHYFLSHTTETVSLTINGERFTAETRGKGVLDKPRVINLLLTDLKHFYLVPVTRSQQLQSIRSAGDFSYDSEFIFSYREGERIKIKRVFVNSCDASFEQLLNRLKQKCPDANLLHLQPAAALKQIGAASAAKTTRILLTLLIGIPVLIALVFIISKIMHH